MADTSERKKATSKADRRYESDHVECESLVDTSEEMLEFQQIVESQGPNCTEFIRDKLEAEAKKRWDIFYKEHYIQREFSDLEEWLSVPGVEETERKTLFEDFFAADFSPRAVNLIRDRLAELSVPEERCRLWVCDLVKDTIPDYVKADFTTLIFVLSALSPETISTAIANVFSSLKPGGVVFLRDYAVFDLTQLRFKKGAKIADNFYVRGDGTRTYFLTTELLEQLMLAAGFELVSNVYVRKTIRNKKLGNLMRRCWIQAKFRRPLQANTGVVTADATSDAGDAPVRLSADSVEGTSTSTSDSSNNSSSTSSGPSQ